ncbi:FkbM family methyltransferase [Spongiibacter sp. KMU-158]|uniref:FkbM family methyltransferase n=1 Tax=Spongiibacter pelagi TaxID=2760804 RepID=A0A927C318_9GAMM|nr:FkbM family methyltransferase [Spongiibacter pelagi]
MVDVGANIGYYSVLGAAAVGSQGKVFAFEPEPANFSLLEENLRLNGIRHTKAINAALSVENAPSTLFLSENNWGDHQIYSRGETRRQVSIDLVRGDDILGNAISRIDLLKIDTQGAEFKVISGLENLIRQSLPELSIIIEFWPFGLKKAGDHGLQLLDLLASFELPIWMIDHLGHALHPCSIAELREWVDALDADPDNEGFFNLLLSSQGNQF